MQLFGDGHEVAQQAQVELRAEDGVHAQPPIRPAAMSTYRSAGVITPSSIPYPSEPPRARM
jgi:hypothetical protein